MKTCSLCSLEKPIESFPVGRAMCNPCYSNYRKEKRKSYKETIRVANQRYYENNKENLKKSCNEYYHNNSEKMKASQKLWRDSHKDEIRIAQAAWVKNNPEKKKQSDASRDPEKRAASDKNWRLNNPEKKRESNRRRRAILNGVISNLTMMQEKEVWEEFEGKCFWCGREATCLDHIVPLRPRENGLRGNHTRNNVVPSCQPCNSRKNNKDPLIFLFSTCDIRGDQL